ncbi:MAG: response regulator [Polaromonas sp.]|nr:response regulator [Polaromonas sp.]
MLFAEKPVLVVEDNPDHLELTVLTLVEQGVQSEIVTAKDGVEALDYLFCQGVHLGRDIKRQPAFILLDMKLPRLSGLDVLRRLRANPNTALVPVIMLTSSSERSDMVACYQAGASGFVRKPVDFGEFTDKLGAVQHYWLQVNESIASELP